MSRLCGDGDRLDGMGWYGDRPDGDKGEVGERPDRVGWGQTHRYGVGMEVMSPCHSLMGSSDEFHLE